MAVFRTISNSSEAEYKENKSRFLAFAYPIKDVNDVKSLIDNLKTKYFDARHHTFAYKIGYENPSIRTFDDREPNHTAGDKILSAIESEGLTDVLVVVVRYFGGIKLGAANLGKAYREAAYQSLHSANQIDFTPRLSLSFNFPFSQMAAVNKFLNEYKFTKETYKYLSANQIELRVEQENLQKYKDILSEIHGIELL